MARSSGGPGGGSDPGNSGGGSGSGGSGSSGAGNGSSGGGRSSGAGGGGYGGAVGAGVDASSGRSSGSGGSGGGGGGYSSGFGAEVDTGGTSNGGLGSNDGVSQAAIDAAREVSGYDSAASAAESAFGGWQSEVDTQMGPQNVGYERSTPQSMAIATRPQISQQAHTAALEVGGLTDINNQAASPSTLASIGAGLLSAANPALGIAAKGYQMHSAAKKAQSMTADTNAAFGTSVDHGYADALGAQARGAVAGMAGGRIGGQAGASIGAAITGNPAGAIAGALAGGTALGSFASRQAKGSMGGSTPSDGNHANSSGNARDNANLASATDIARARQEAERNQEGQPMGVANVDNSQMYGYKPAQYRFDSLADATTRIFG